MFNYLNDSIVWSGRFGVHAHVGYTDGVGSFAYSHPNSNTPAIATIDQTTNINITGRWLFRSTPSCTGAFLAQRKCLNWVSQDRSTYPSVEAFALAARPCPPSFFQASSDRRFSFWRFYSQSRFCFRQRFASRVESTRVFGVRNSPICV